VISSGTDLNRPLLEKTDVLYRIVHAVNKNANISERDNVYVRSLGGYRMHDPKSLRDQARKCRALSKTAVEPEVIEQLRVWSVELAEEAEKAEWHAAERDEAIVVV
jgi:hypothetical protein